MSRAIVVVGAGTDVVQRVLWPAADRLVRRGEDRWPEGAFVLGMDSDRATHTRVQRSKLPPDNVGYVPLTIEQVRDTVDREPDRFRDILQDSLRSFIAEAPPSGASRSPALGRLMVRAASGEVLHHLERIGRELDRTPEVFVVHSPVAGTSRGAVLELHGLVRATWPSAMVSALVLYPVDMDGLDPGLASVYRTNFVEGLRILETCMQSVRREVYLDVERGWQPCEGGLVDHVIAFDHRYGNRSRRPADEPDRRLVGGLPKLLRWTAAFIARVMDGDPLTGWFLGRLSDATLGTAAVGTRAVGCISLNEMRVALDPDALAPALIERGIERVLAGDGDGPQVADGGSAFPASPERVRGWLSERLVRLESSVREAPEVDAVARSGRAEVLPDLQVRPDSFVADVNERAQRFASRIVAEASAAADRLGLRFDRFEQICFDRLAADVEGGRQVIEESIDVLRTRAETLGREGHGAFDGARQVLDGELSEMRKVLDRSAPRRLRRWLGFGASPPVHEDSALRLEFKAVARRADPRLESALEQMGHAAISLSIARHYGALANRLLEAATLAGVLARGRPAVLARVHVALGRALRSSEGGSFVGSLMSPLLDTILGRYGVTTEAFLRRTRPALARGHPADDAELERIARDFVVAHLGELGTPSLREALGGGSEDEAPVHRTMARMLAESEPLLSFDDQFAAARTRERCRYFVAARTTDGSLLTALAEVCDQLGLPPPDGEVIRAEGQERLEIMQAVTGVTFLSQAARLEDALRAHASVMGSAVPATELGIASVELLRDTTPEELDPRPRAWQTPPKRRAHVPA